MLAPPNVRHPRLVARYHKLFAHEFFPESRWSVWLDANVDHDLPLEAAVDALERSGLAIAAFTHPAGRDVGEEFDACWRYGRFLRRDKWRAFAQLRHFVRERFPLHTAVTENRVLIRDHHHARLPGMMRLLWSMLSQYTSRDQLSLQYALWKFSEAALLLDGVDGLSSDRLKVRPHAGPASSIVRILAYRLSRLRRLSPRLGLLRNRLKLARRAFADPTGQTGASPRLVEGWPRRAADRSPV